MAGVTLRRSGMSLFMNSDMRTFAVKISRRVVNEIRIRAPRETGRLQAMIKATEIIVRGYSITFKVTAETGYSLYPEKGTGIYVGRGYIRPKRGSYLVFRPKRSAKLVFARKVKGQPGQHYMRDGLVAAISHI